MDKAEAEAKRWCEEQTKLGHGFYTFVEHNVKEKNDEMRFEGETAKFKFRFRPSSTTVNQRVKEVQEDQQKKMGSATNESFKNKFKVSASAAQEEMMQEQDSICYDSYK